MTDTYSVKVERGPWCWVAKREDMDPITAMMMPNDEVWIPYMMAAPTLPPPFEGTHIYLKYV